MVIECPSCKARYNLSPALIGGSRGARVRCRKCGDRFDVRNPGMPPPQEAVESPPVEFKREKEPEPPKPSQAPAVSAEVPPARDTQSSPQFQYRERESHRSGRGTRSHPTGRKTAYYLAGPIIILLGIAVTFLFHTELRRDPPSAPDKTSQDVHISQSYYFTSPMGVQMFVLQGSVRDTRKGGVSTPIRLRARIFNANKDVIAEKTVLAGFDTPGIGYPPGIALDNTVFKEGWLPFHVLFFDPGAIADYSVTMGPA